VTDPRHVLFLLVIALAAAAGCAGQPTATARGAEPPAPATQAPAAIAAHETPAPTAVATASGAVAETMDAGSYTYVRVATDTGDVWAAASRFDIKVGDRVTVPLEMPMRNFHSNSLNRDFPVIYFTSRIIREGETAEAGGPGAGAAQLAPGAHPPAQPVAAVTEVVPQPAGATSVAKVWEGRKVFAGQAVTVRGKVVKVNAGIMGRNWIHLQDGTGSAADRTNDLTATTSAEFSVGDVVTVTGILAADKDFGAGYAYPVILENVRPVK